MFQGRASPRPRGITRNSSYCAAKESMIYSVSGKKAQKTLDFLKIGRKVAQNAAFSHSSLKLPDCG